MTQLQRLIQHRRILMYNYCFIEANGILMYNYCFIEANGRRNARKFYMRPINLSRQYVGESVLVNDMRELDPK